MFVEKVKCCGNYLHLRYHRYIFFSLLTDNSRRVGMMRNYCRFRRSTDRNGRAYSVEVVDVGVAEKRSFLPSPWMLPHCSYYLTIKVKSLKYLQ